ncbi:MAG: hypothetical protein RIT27_1460 [Pseudomonadota bacterium]|jgi:hypothetical protein
MEHGFPTKDWDKAKEETRNLLVERAKRKNTIAYSEVSAQIAHIIYLDAHDPRLGYLLGEISEKEHFEKRGMLSVLVVHLSGDMKPGKGFFELAGELGYDVSDKAKKEKFWIDELIKVYNYWSEKL